MCGLPTGEFYAECCEEEENVRISGNPAGLMLRSSR